MTDVSRLPLGMAILPTVAVNPDRAAGHSFKVTANETLRAQTRVQQNLILSRAAVALNTTRSIAINASCCLRCMVQTAIQAWPLEHLQSCRAVGRLSRLRGVAAPQNIIGTSRRGTGDVPDHDQ